MKTGPVLMILGIVLWLVGSALLIFGGGLPWRFVGAFLFAAGIGLVLFFGLKGRRRP
ncbi:fatty acid desaturase [Leifsonia sp. 1010]|nr:fatty acid desaturase [Leifsonia sp. 1010]